jgi:hypothetical protein
VVRRRVERTQGAAVQRAIHLVAKSGKGSFGQKPAVWSNRPQRRVATVFVQRFK